MWVGVGFEGVWVRWFGGLDVYTLVIRVVFGRCLLSERAGVGCRVSSLAFLPFFLFFILDQIKSDRLGTLRARETVFHLLVISEREE